MQDGTQAIEVTLLRNFDLIFLHELLDGLTFWVHLAIVSHGNVHKIVAHLVLLR